jgi:SAM-dependent methyltransferase
LAAASLEGSGVLDDVVGFLACPNCGAAVTRTDAVVRCARGHSFDVARQGYVSMLPARQRGDAGDTAAMVAARERFLQAGHYAGLAGKVADLAAAVTGAAPAPETGTTSAPGAGGSPPGCVVDVGAGTGYYLAAVLDRLPGRAGVALDTSRFALRRAARCHPRAGAVGADAWSTLPVADAAAALVLNIFAPRNGGELRRILSPAGRLVVVAAAPGHLTELAGPLGLLRVADRKDERLAATMSPHLVQVYRESYSATAVVSRAEAAAAAQMGPTAWHVSEAELTIRAEKLPARLPVTISVTLSIFAP